MMAGVIIRPSFAGACSEPVCQCRRLSVVTHANQKEGGTQKNEPQPETSPGAPSSSRDHLLLLFAAPDS